MDVRAFLRIALDMTLDQAKTTLGLPLDSNPTADEVRAAQRRKLREMGHADQGGDPKKMVELNIAADILTGRQEPSDNYDRRPSADPGGAYDYGGYGGVHINVNPRNIEVDFDQAKSKANVPAGVEWLFVTDTQRQSGGYSSDEFHRSARAYVAYGRKDDTHFFVGMLHKQYDAYQLKEHEDIWEMKVLTLHPSPKEIAAPAWYYGNVVKALNAVGFEGRFNSKVFDCRGWNFDEKFKTNGGSTSIKHILVNLELLAADDERVVNRKHVVELTYLRSSEETDKTYKWPGGYDAQGIKLTVNGRDFYLSKTDAQQVIKARVGSKPMLDAIFKGYYYGDSSKVLTRIQGAKVVLNWMAEKLTDLPSNVRETLAAAGAQAK